MPRVAAYVALIIILAGYFAWILIEMAGHLAGGRGDARLIRLVIGVGLGAAALLVGLLFGRGRRRSSEGGPPPSTHGHD